MTRSAAAWNFLILGITLVGMVSQSQAVLSANDGGEAKVQPVVAMKAQAFPLQDVRLLDGPFKQAMELDRQYLLSLDPERLLHNFRLNAGLPSKAEPLGGWEEPKCEVRGHFVGHYLSGCALMYAATGDERLRAKGDAVVAGLAECQSKLGNDYLSAYPESFIDRVEALQPVWAPYYTLHKIYAGLLDMYVFCGNRQALEVCKKFADWVIARNAKLSDEQMQRMLGNEHGGMNEVLANLYALTGEEKYLKIAQRFNHAAVIGPASKHEDRLTGLHANTQVPKFIGTARQFELAGQEPLKTASLFFWDTVVKERSYVIGGHSDGEMFSPKEKLSHALGPNTTETCNTYNMLKLTRHLFCWDLRAEYADYYERALYNHILASQNPADGMMCYYVPLRSGSRKEYSSPLDTFACCTGTGVENHAKYGDSIYFHDGLKTLYVNLFIASELNWKGRGLKLRQETKYPDQQTSRLVFACEKPIELTLNIRHPFWAESGFEVSVNGRKEAVESKPGSYAAIARTWNNGDTVEISLPFALRTEGFRDNPQRLAFLHGPLVLAAEVAPKPPFPVVVAEKESLLAGLKPVAGKSSTFAASPEVFQSPGQQTPRDLVLEPFYKIHGERHYVVYWDTFTPEQWRDKKAERIKKTEVEKPAGPDSIKPAGESPEPIRAIDPPEKDFFSKRLDYAGIPIMAHKDVDDAALREAKQRLGLLLDKVPGVLRRIVAVHAELHIIGRNQVTSDLPEHRHLKGKPFEGQLTVDERTRGLGGLLVSCGEENLLRLEQDRYRGRDICVHEFAHCIFEFGMTREVREKFCEQRKRSLAAGRWVKSYAGSDDDEFFAELTMWYIGTHGDLSMEGAKPDNGRDGIKEYDPDALKLMDDFYSGRMEDESYHG